MRILVVSATAFEVVPLANEFNTAKDIHFLYTGVGMVAATFAVTQHLVQHTYDLVIHAGIAGGFDKSMPLGSVFQLVEDAFSELGAEDDEVFLGIDDLGFGTASTRAFLPEAWQQCLPKMSKVKGITVNTVHGNTSSIAKIRERFPHVALETMEAAAVMQVCEKLQIPCLSVRSTSNYVEVRQRDAWNIPLAVERLNQELILILNAFQHL